MNKVNYWQTFEENQTYHIYNRSVSETDLYRTEDNYRYFLKQWQKYLGNYMEVLAYCLMLNHFHFLTTIKPVNEPIRAFIQKENTVAASNFLHKEITYNIFLEDQFKRLFSSYSLAFNKQHQRRGALFQKRFKRVQLHNIESIIDKLYYIHHNPIHHGFTVFYQGWDFSSYAAYFSGKPTKVAVEAMMDMFSTFTELSKPMETQTEVQPQTQHQPQTFTKPRRFSKRGNQEKLLDILKGSHEKYKIDRGYELLDFNDF